ncbi:MAG: class I SAM-dependent methyltransferase [Planctomycetes bacterium]|nr:class I SAM-dependent methyltransferase [Planctomycetota bacterium]
MYSIGRVRFDLVRCKRCGLVYVNPRPTSAVLEALYDDPEYYTHGYNLGVETENYFARKHELIAQYEDTLAEYERETETRAGDLLELGSAGGFLLEAGRRRGWRVKGVEISPPAAEYSAREFGLEIHRGLLETAPYAEQSFDLAVADNVLEHTLRPDEVLARLHDLLRPGGHLIVIVPSYVNSAWFRGFAHLRSLLPRRFLGRQVLALLKFDGEDAGYPYHILEFDRATLTRLLRAAGFEIAKTEGSVPLPAHLFKDKSPTLRTRCLRFMFATLDRLMRLGLLPAARLRIVARRVR